MSGAVELVDEVMVCSSRGVEFLAPFGQVFFEVKNLLFEFGDTPLHLVDVIGCAKSGLAPGLVTHELGQLLLQLPDP